MPLVDVDRLRYSGRRFTSGFTTGQKTITVVGIGALALGAFAFMRWASSPRYVPLYSGIDPAEAGDVTAELESMGVDYKLESGGTTIMVAKSDVYETRVALSSKGLPTSGGEGWSLLDEGGITQDEFSKRVDYQRALQGELARTIEAIDGVAAASVTITVPQDSVFVGEEAEQASAAVLVQPVNKGALDSETVQAIVHLVSSSVPNLAPEQVTVADSYGNVLAAPGAEGGMDGTEQLERTQSYEATLSRDLESLIAASLGPGHAKASVRADLDFDTRTTTSETYAQPDGASTPTVASTETETFTGPGGAVAGVLGPDGTPLNQGQQTPTNYSKSTTEQQLALDKVQETREAAPGTVDSLSVSVLLDSEQVAANELAQWTTALTTAAGVDATRGDQITVTRMPFDDTIAKEAEEQLAAAKSADSQGFVLDALRYVATLLIVLIVLFLAWRAVKRSALATPVRVPLDLRELEAAERAAATAALAQHASMPVSLPEPPRPLPESSDAEAQIAALIDQQPDQVAQTLRSWLADRRS